MNSMPHSYWIGCLPTSWQAKETLYCPKIAGTQHSLMSAELQLGTGRRCRSHVTQFKMKWFFHDCLKFFPHSESSLACYKVSI